ncbi:MAG: hypothetical protein ACE5EF_12220 [Dehalococcoidia bacterium]
MRLRIVVATAAAAGLLSGACLWGGDDLLFDPARGDDLAHAALPDVEDIPGDDWSLVAIDEFDEGDSQLPADTTNCRRMLQMSDAVDESSDRHRTGRAKIEVARAGSNDIDTEIEVHVSVFEDTDTPRDALETFRRYFKSSALRGCFEDLLKESVREFPGLEVDSQVVASASEVVSDAEGAAFVVKVEGDGVSIGFRMELYAWRTGNAGISVEIAGAEGDISREDVEALLTALQLGVKEAARTAQ